MAVAAAAAISATLCGLIAWAGPVDAPQTGSQARSSHRRPTPTSGGLAILAGASAGGWLAAAGGGFDPFARQVASALAFAGALGLLGALDDVYDFGARPKLLAQAVLALAFAVFVARVQALPIAGGLDLPLGPVFGVIGTALWIVVAVNAMNFMDGANGVAAGAAAVALGALGLAALLAGALSLGAVALAGAGASLGFLPWNLGGRLFQGDAGSLFAGFLFAALAVIATRDAGGVYLYFAPIAFLPFLADVLLTLLLRARRRRPLLAAHRDHLYQVWLAGSGRSHLQLAWRTWAVMTAFAVLSLALCAASAGVRLVGFIVAVVVSVVGWLVLRRDVARSRRSPSQQYPPP